MAQSRSLLLDKLGAFASAACAVHCILTGVAVGLLSVVGIGFVASPATELAFVLTICILGTLAVVQGYRKHRSLLPMSLYVGGLFFVVFGHFLTGDHSHSNAATTLVAVTGGLLMMTFHVVNLRMQHRCSVCHPEDLDPVR